MTPRLAWPVLIAWAACALPAQADWSPVYDIDFSRVSALDPALWAFETGFVRNRESQYYTPANVSLQGGALVIEARREPHANAAWRAGTRDWRASRRQADYTSGALVLRPPLQFGRIELMARSPSGRGVWPAIWLLHEAPGEYGEIDLYEFVGKHPDTVFGAVHFGRKANTREHRGGSIVLPGFENSWRLHALEWTPERIEMSVDGKTVFRFDPREAADAGIDPLRRPMQLHINLALGGNWGAEIDDKALPARFEIRSLRVLRWEAVSAAPAANAPAAAGAPEPAPLPAPAPAPRGAPAADAGRNTRGGAADPAAHRSS